MTQPWVELLTKQWRELPFVVIDTETTGVGEGHAVVEIGAARFEGGNVTGRYSALVNPGRDIPPEASALHGIHDADVADKPPLAELAGELAKVCTGAIPAAFNAPFDKGMLHASITGNDCLAFVPDCPWLDIFVAIASPKQDKWVPGPGRLRLEACCKRHGITLKSAHRAADDAEAAGLLFLKIMGDSKVTLKAVLDRMAAARAEQDADHAAFVKKIREQERVIWRGYACAAMAGLGGGALPPDLAARVAAENADEMVRLERERYGDSK